MLGAVMFYDILKKQEVPQAKRCVEKLHRRPNFRKVLRVCWDVCMKYHSKLQNGKGSTHT